MSEKDPTNFDSVKCAHESAWAAQWWLMFAIMVANKNAEQTKRKLDRLLFILGCFGEDKDGWFPFSAIKEAIKIGNLGAALQEVRSGQYTRIERAFRALINANWHGDQSDDPRRWSLAELESIPGVGPKTARWFYLLILPDAEVAALDTHVLKFLRDNAPPIARIPQSTPPAGKYYQSLEQDFIEHAKRLGMRPRDLDFFVWAAYRSGYKLVKR